MNQPQLPQCIGRYEIVREIGRGGMGIVYEANDVAFERLVALKVLPHERLTDDTMRARFLREARLIAALEHEAIVPVYDYGDEDERPYFVMRLMPGGSLATRMRGESLDVEESVAYIERLAPALDAAHQRSIIHRDLKPGNILFDNQGLPYLSDFGIAKLGAGGETSASQLIGTPAYMSPEQVNGSALDGRSDQYALGILLWEMLTGSLPFQADSPIQLVMKHLNEPVPMLRDVRPDLPKGLEGILSRALAKEPKDRFPNVAAMARALRAVVPAPPQFYTTPSAGGPPRPSATPPSGGMRLPSLPRITPPSLGGIPIQDHLPTVRRAWPIALLSVTTLLALALLGGLLLRNRGAAPDEGAGGVAVIQSATPDRQPTATVEVAATATGERLLLPTQASGEGSVVTSTPLPELPTATPQPTATPAPTRNPLAFTRLTPAGGVRISGPLNVSITLEGLPANARAELWMGGDPLYRVTNMQREGASFYGTVNAPPNQNYGNWLWQARVYSNNELILRSDARPFFWVNPAPPAAPPAAPTAPPAVPPPSPVP